MPTKLKLGPSAGTTIAKGAAGFLNLKRVFDDAQRQNKWRQEEMLFKEKNDERRSLRSEEGATKRTMMGERGAAVRTRIGAGYNPTGSVGEHIASGAPLEWGEGVGGPRVKIMNAARKETRMRVTSANNGMFNQNLYDQMLPSVIAEMTGEEQPEMQGGGGPQGPGMGSQAMDLMGKGLDVLTNIMQGGGGKVVQGIFKRVMKRGRITQRDVQRLLSSNSWDELNLLADQGLINIDQENETITVN